LKPTTAANVMTRGVLTVDADWSVAELATFLENHSISGAPVVDGKGALVGVVSLSDIARGSSLSASPSPEAHAFYSHGLERAVAREEASRFRVDDSPTTVRQIMTPMVFSVDASAPVHEVADTMIRGHIHRLFVMEQGKMVGVISALDLLSLVRDT
jgi:CBS domain-containing protein